MARKVETQWPFVNLIVISAFQNLLVLEMTR